MFLKQLSSSNNRLAPKKFVQVFLINNTLTVKQQTK